jgi:hypothetical protein
MATTTNFSWATPDDSANVKDGAAAIRSLGTAVDTTVATMVPKTIVDAKGDIIAATAADTVDRLAVGANNTVLTADSSTATGLKWATPASGGMTQLLTGSVSGGSVTSSNIPSGYKSLVIMARDFVFNSSQQMSLRFNENTGSVYQISAHNPSTSSVQNSSLTATSIDLTQASTIEATRNNCFTITIPDYTESRLKYGQIFGFMTRPGNSPVAFNGVFHMNSTAAITSVTFNMSAGSFTSGTYIIYGVN